MADGHGERQNRLERRKQRTRAALIQAAQAFIAAGKLNVPVLDITQAADVGMGPILSDRGLAPRALRDIIAANRAGRFHVADPQLALAMAAGTLLALGQLLQDQPERDDAQASDQMTEDLLCIFGIPAAEAREICSRPLPDIASIAAAGSVA